jgi:glycosyltransferase involved in cell wall biosynthesis
VLIEFATRVVAVTRTHARYVRSVTGIPHERLTVIENGIDLAQWPRVSPARRREARDALGISPAAAVVTMVAAMRPEKAHEVLLRAVSLLAGSGRPVRVLLAGDGPRRGALEDLAQRQGIRGCIDFLGVRRDVARLLHASDVVVLPSRSVVETLPLSVLEAMACGVPVVASRVGSVPDVVEDGRTGRLVEPGDEVALARAVAATLDDGVTTASMVDAARERVETRYAIEHTTAGYERLFDEVLSA